MLKIVITNLILVGFSILIAMWWYHWGYQNGKDDESRRWISQLQDDDRVTRRHIPRNRLMLCRAVLEELDEGLLHELIAETREYPVEFRFAGYRFVFLSEQEVHEMIAWLRREVGQDDDSVVQAQDAD